MSVDQELLKKIISAIKSFAHVEKIILFGSRARGDDNKHSDYDFAVVGANITQREWLDLCECMEEIETLLMIDVIWFNKAAPALQQKVLQEGKIIYERC